MKIGTLVKITGKSTVYRVREVDPKNDMVKISAAGTNVARRHDHSGWIAARRLTEVPE